MECCYKNFFIIDFILHSTLIALIMEKIKPANKILQIFYVSN